MSYTITQTQYKFLEQQPVPRILRTALELYGTQEIVGSKHNPVIMQWAKDLELHKVYTADEIAWCGLFAAIVVHKALYKNQVVKDPLWARNWLNYGNKVKSAALGDILVFSRPGGGGHVGFYVGEDATCYHVLGGNQSNRVNITRIMKNRLLGIRRTKWELAQPSSVIKLVYNADGTISQNEA